MNAAIRCLVQDLDCLPACAGLDELFAVVNVHAINLDDVADHVLFDPERYHRELIVNADDYQILVLGWLPGQKSPIHNHRGSQCCVRVLQGTAVETIYSHTRDGFFETRTDRYAAGTLFGGEDADIHTVENAASARQGLVTLHVYRPVLSRMELFDVKNDRLVVREPAVLRLS
ncbi:MAG: cysteine dioxygenase family protein [Planctomycetota bacterium]|nr:cysteine dioxygenase family protein [Planctomycetota bacterium]